MKNECGNNINYQAHIDIALLLISMARHSDNPFEQFAGRFVLKIGKTIATNAPIDILTKVLINGEDFINEKVPVTLMFPDVPEIQDYCVNAKVYNDDGTETIISMFKIFDHQPLFYGRVPMATTFSIEVLIRDETYSLGSKEHCFNPLRQLEECGICFSETICYINGETYEGYKKQCSCKGAICYDCFSEIAKRQRKCPFCRTPFQRDGSMPVLHFPYYPSVWEPNLAMLNFGLPRLPHEMEDDRRAFERRIRGPEVHPEIDLSDLDEVE